MEYSKKPSFREGGYLIVQDGSLAPEARETIGDFVLEDFSFGEGQAVFCPLLTGLLVSAKAVAGTVSLSLFSPASD
jgi:hypothetical protein